jgi:hypothetical protein
MRHASPVDCIGIGIFPLLLRVTYIPTKHAFQHFDLGCYFIDILGDLFLLLMGGNNVLEDFLDVRLKIKDLMVGRREGGGGS